MPSSLQRGCHVPWMCLRMCPREVYSLVTRPVSLFPAEMHEKPTVILGVFLDPVIQSLNLFLIEEPENPLLELARPLTGNDLDHRRLLRHRLVDDGTQRPVDVLAPIIDIVQVQLELHRAVFPTVGWTQRSRCPGACPGRVWARSEEDQSPVAVRPRRRMISSAV